VAGIIDSSATQLARAIRDKEISSEEVVEAHLQRIEEVNPRLNAVVQIMAESAREAARRADVALARGESLGPLHGVPVTIKDNLDVAGVVCTAGTKGRANYVPAEDATVVARLRGAGAIVLGKTNVPEFAMAYETDNLIYGRTNNPYDLSRTCGGSSGGEAAIIAAGGSPRGLGNDAAGSIRVPSHFCGIAGIRPTTGRTPLTGSFPPPGGVLTPLWQCGPMARHVEDLALALPIIAGVDWRDPQAVPMPLGDPAAVALKGLRVAFHADNGIAPPTPEIAEAVTGASQVLADSGAVVEEARPACLAEAFGVFFTVLTVDGGAGVDGLLRQVGTTELHPFLAGLHGIQHANARPLADAFGVLEQWDRWRAAMLSFMENYDAILCPVTATPAPPHGTTFAALANFSYASTYNLTGWPGAVVRAGTSPEGLPIGVQIVARPWREDVALALARQVESARGGWQAPLL
jgi:amidase